MGFVPVPRNVMSAASKPIVMVAAMDQNRVIGDGAEIPWHIPGEQRLFRQLTMGKPLILGRLTYETLPNPLPGRHCIVLSKAAGTSKGVAAAKTVEEALRLAETLPGEEIMVGGGQQIYELFLPLVHRIYLTEIHATFGGNRFFPKIDGRDFRLVSSETVRASVPYSRNIFERAVSVI